MLDQNTDRMWYVIGAVLIGAAIILIANGSIPQMFASVTDSFEEVAEEATTGLKVLGTDDENTMTDGIGPQPSQTDGAVVFQGHNVEDYILSVAEQLDDILLMTIEDTYYLANEDNALTDYYDTTELHGESYYIGSINPESMTYNGSITTQSEDGDMVSIALFDNVAARDTFQTQAYEDAANRDPEYYQDFVNTVELSSGTYYMYTGYYKLNIDYFDQ